MSESNLPEPSAPFVTRRSLADAAGGQWQAVEPFAGPVRESIMPGGLPGAAAQQPLAAAVRPEAGAPQAAGQPPVRQSFSAQPLPAGGPSRTAYQPSAGQPLGGSVANPGASTAGYPPPSGQPFPGAAAPAPSQSAPVFNQAPPPPLTKAPAPPPSRQADAGTAGGGPAAPAPSGVRSQGRVGLSRAVESDDLALDEALRVMVQAGASDLHLTAGSPPMMRLNGSLRALEGAPVVVTDSLQRTLYSIVTQKQREKFEANLELDFSYAVRGLARFRVNFYQQRESIGAAFRVIPYEIKPLEDLGVPPVVANFANLPRGLVLVTGPTGSGKSTTLASIIDLANRTRTDHIMTVEDPIEFLHRHKKSIINQREVGADTHSFANALKHVLRQDPDIILVGEMRDLETISVALTAAETGHLVFATLHTQDAAQTIDRIIDVFPPEQQGQVRTQLAGALQGVVSQTLCKRADGPGRAVATEVMIATPAVRNLIREGKTHQVYSAMQAGKQLGMHTMDQHLADLVRQGRISYETGLEKCHHIEDFNRLTGRAGGSTGAGYATAGFGGSDYSMGGN